ncbi:DUF4197 domain-containing protein [Nitratiruptor tergarcus]|uniref:DUF4197 domain-containing protein n=1 Tax=Nitratiruptor tergarcus DSM 16512 TaxID=1069081 RepID=A0A1W1WUT8_9BACT|nr:DUF4197 domain-containing protein [Nitratiruptor tergarcus]SMC10006.1 Protein of unknown function [Nitratiruptor tergarcus DSM 16512]
MKKLLFLPIIALIAQAGFMDTLNNLAKDYTSNKSITNSANEEQSAIKQALKIGVKKAVTTLGKKDGFLKNPLVKIGVPKNLQIVAKTLRKVGMGKYVDEFELSMNRAAEEAVPETASILVDTIKNLKVQEAKRLITSSDNYAITNYFKTHAGKKLAQKIAPIIKKHMENENVTKYYVTMMEYYNKYASNFTNNAYAKTALGALGMSAPGEVKEKDLSSYVTNRTLEGLYTMIAQQEKNIRTNPLARSTKLLQKVFGDQK